MITTFEISRYILKSREIHVRFLALFQTLFEDLVIDERVVLMLRLLLFYEYRARMIVVEHIICFYVCESKEEEEEKK